LSRLLLGTGYGSVQTEPRPIKFRPLIDSTDVATLFGQNCNLCGYESVSTEP